MYKKILFIVIVLCVLIINSINISAQDILLNKIYIPENSYSIKTILNKITDQCGYSFLYTSYIQPQKIINLKCDSITIKQCLNKIFNTDSVKFIAKEDKIILSPKTEENIHYTKKYKVTGLVVDSKSKDPVSYANVYLKDRSIGTITNTDGRFELNVSSENKTDTLIFSSLGYFIEELDTRSNADSNLTVFLKPSKILIKEIVIRPADPIQLITAANDNIRRNYDKTPSVLTAFFRESVKQDNNYVSLSEALVSIYKQPYQNSRNDLIKFEKGRNATNVESEELISFIVKGSLYNNMQLDIVKNGVSFLDKEFFDLYDYKYEKSINYENKHTYIISFEQKDGVQYALYKGRLYLDAESLAIVKATFGLSKKGLNYSNDIYIRKIPFGFKAKPVSASYDVNYRFYNNKWNLNNIYSEFVIKVKKRRLSNNDKLSSTFTTTSEYVITKKDTMNVQPYKWSETSKLSDVLFQQIDKGTEKFWADNNIILPEESLEETFIKLLQIRKNEDLTKDEKK